MGKPLKNICFSETACMTKLRKSLVLKRSVKAGHVLKKSDFTIKVAKPSGIDGNLLTSVIGKRIKCDIQEDQALIEDFLI